VFQSNVLPAAARQKTVLIYYQHIGNILQGVTSQKKMTFVDSDIRTSYVT